MATGHYPPSRIVDLATGTVTTAPSSSGMVSVYNFWVVFLWTNDHALVLTSRIVGSVVNTLATQIRPDIVAKSLRGMATKGCI